MRRLPLSSLRWRLLAGTVAALVLALALAGLALAALFRAEIDRQLDEALAQQLDQLTALAEFDAQGQLLLDDSRLIDPRWRRPYSGLYWQASRSSAPGLMRSRSLWDVTLAHAALPPTGADVVRFDVAGPQGAVLRAGERVVHPTGQPQQAWRLLVAADRSAATLSEARFRQTLGLSLGLLLLLLVLAAWAQVAVGLAPLRALQKALQAVREGRATHIEGPAPDELQPLVRGFNEVLSHNAEMVARAHRQAGNLAHAVKTPLAVMSQAAQATQVESTPLARLVQEQTDAARRQVDWHLARARAAAHKAFVAERVLLAPVVAGLLRVMQRVHAQRGLSFQADGIDPAAAWLCAEQDAQEMLGTVLDNACKWAHGHVRVSAQRAPQGWSMQIDDDGPGIEPPQRDLVLARGARLDETVPGSGLGLDIAQELALAYGGALSLDRSPLGGLRVTLCLPGWGEAPA